MTAHVDNTEEFQLTATDGTRLFVRDWPLAPSAVLSAASAGGSSQGNSSGVLIMHGLGEHCGRYAHVARFFNALGFTVRTYDHRGHGQSDGARGDVPDGEAMLRDARLVINDFSKQLHAPPILFGHSMGGLFAARFATAGLAPLRALILSSPALAIRMSGFQSALLKVLCLLVPGVGIPNGLKTRFLSHDAEVIEAYENDGLVHGKVTARLLNSMLQAMKYAHDRAAQLTMPVLLLVAEEDHLVDPVGSKRFFASLPGTSAKAIYYDNFYHEIFNELDACRVFEDLCGWLVQKHLIPTNASNT